MDVEAPPGATVLSVKQKRPALRQKPERFPFVTGPRKRGSLAVLLASQRGASLSSPLLIQNHGIHC